MSEVWLQQYNAYITYESIWDGLVTPFICHMYWLGRGLTSHLNKKIEAYLYFCYNTYWKTKGFDTDAFIVPIGVRTGTTRRDESTCHQICKYYLLSHLLNQEKYIIER